MELSRHAYLPTHPKYVINTLRGRVELNEILRMRRVGFDSRNSMGSGLIHWLQILWEMSTEMVVFGAELSLGTEG